MIGRTLGSYRIVEQIGMGGMATVYKAYDPNTDRYVALKILPDYYSLDPKFKQRFEREAKAIAKLEHLHILPVHAYGEDGDTAYLVMRYMETGTLKERIQANPMPISEASRLLGQIASALDYAHQHGVLHRDVKSSNVLLDSENNAYLTDFGIAKMIEGASELTGSGIIGTPQYMSPEQCQGRKDLTGATDVYSLGVMLYEMLTGRTPYQAETPLAVIHMQITGSPLPPPSSLRSDLSEDIEAVILKALAQEPKDRWPTCGAMAQAFAQAVAARVEATKPSTPTEAALPSTPPTRKVALEDDLGLTIPAPAKADKETAAPAPDMKEPQTSKRRLPVWVFGLAGLLIIAALFFLALRLRLLGGTREVLMCEEGHGLCISRNGGEPRTIFSDNTMMIGGSTWAPDRKNIAFNGRKEGEDQDFLYIIEPDGSNLTKLAHRCNDVDPAWSPDGEWIVFHSCGELVMMHPDGSEMRELGNACALMPQWSPDSAWIVASVGVNGCPDKLPFIRDVRVISRDSTTIRTVATTTFEKQEANFSVAFSPDGKQIAYVDENNQAWLVPADGSGEPIKTDKFPILWTGKVFPQWGR
jgi:serine/threonine protein kinase